MPRGAGERLGGRQKQELTGLGVCKGHGQRDKTWILTLLLPGSLCVLMPVIQPGVLTSMTRKLGESSPNRVLETLFQRM